MKAQIKLFILFVLFFIIFSNKFCFASNQEITIYDKKEDYIAYIDTSDLTVYLWAGKPVAYLEKNDDYFNIYGFNGKHLGWLENDGLLYDHDGYVVGFIEGALSKKTSKFEPMKGLKQLIPLKSFQQTEPYKPTLQQIWSNFLLSLFLATGRQ